MANNTTHTEVHRKKLLYIMGIDWEWIYQRPQIFAEKLSRDYEVTVIFPRSILHLTRYKHISYKLNTRILWTFPYQEKNRIIGLLADAIHKRIFRDIHSFDAIYIGYPLYQRYIPATYKGLIIYDCMDNYESLYPDTQRVHRIIEQEISLINRCNILIASAKLLQQKVNETAGYSKSILIRNGTTLQKIMPVKKTLFKPLYQIGYIGTIAQWFDFMLINHSLEYFQNIEYHLIGPGADSLVQTGIISHGTVSHNELGEHIRNFDCLVMPFKLNDIVTAVDPVKLYEYITFGKCIISIYYEEISRFDDFVYFYHNEQEYITLMADLIKKGYPPKYSTSQQVTFLSENTWEKRYQILRKQIDRNLGEQREN